MFRSIREKLKFTTAWFTLPITGGPLRGHRWIAFAGKRFLQGTYEPAKTAAVVKSVTPGQTAWDIGGHVGYFAMVESKLVGDTGRVLVFEPRPLNIACIKRHMDINHVSNVTLIEAAVADRPGQARFESRTGTGTGHLSGSGNLQVATVAVDWLIEREGYPMPDFIKIDVEGGEIDAIRGARRTISRRRPRMLVATHGETEHQFVMEFLESLDYEIEVLNESAIKGDREIVAWPAEAG